MAERGAGGRSEPPGTGPAGGRSIRREIRLDVAPVVVWRAFTDEAQFLRWYALEGSWQVNRGGRFWVRNGPTEEEVAQGEFLEVEPPRRLVWRGGDNPDSLVTTVTIEPEGHGTRVVVVQSGFGVGPDWDALFEGFSAGWSFILENLRRFLAEGYDYQRHPYFGVDAAPGDGGLLVRAVRYPWAAHAGLNPGDLIIAVGGRPTAGGVSLWDLARHHAAGEPVEVRVRRAGAEFVTQLVPGSWRDAVAALKARGA